MAALLMSCSSGWEEPCDEPYPTAAMASDSTIVKALLDSNGLGDRRVFGDVLTRGGKCFTAQGFLLDLPREMETLRFIPEIKNLQLFNDLTIRGMGLKTLPEGIRWKKWRHLHLINTQICNPSTEDSLYLAQFDSTWYSSQYCPNKEVSK